VVKKEVGATIRTIREGDRLRVNFKHGEARISFENQRILYN